MEGSSFRLVAQLWPVRATASEFHASEQRRAVGPRHHALLLMSFSQHAARRRGRRDDLIGLLIEYPEPVPAG